MAQDIKEGGRGHYIGLAAIRGLKVPNEPPWAPVSPYYGQRPATQLGLH